MLFKCLRWLVRVRWNIIDCSLMANSKIFPLFLSVLLLLLKPIKDRLACKLLRSKAISNNLFCLVLQVLRCRNLLGLLLCKKLNRVKRLGVHNLLWNRLMLMIRFRRNWDWNCRVIIVSWIKIVRFWFNKRDNTIIGLNRIVYQLNLKGICIILILLKIKKKI